MKSKNQTPPQGKCPLCQDKGVIQEKTKLTWCPACITPHLPWHAWQDYSP